MSNHGMRAFYKLEKVLNRPRDWFKAKVSTDYNVSISNYNPYYCQKNNNLNQLNIQWDEFWWNTTRESYNQIFLKKGMCVFCKQYLDSVEYEMCKSCFNVCAILTRRKLIRLNQLYHDRPLLEEKYETHTQYYIPPPVEYKSYGEIECNTNINEGTTIRYTYSGQLFIFLNDDNIIDMPFHHHSNAFECPAHYLNLMISGIHYHEYPREKFSIDYFLILARDLCRRDLLDVNLFNHAYYYMFNKLLPNNSPYDKLCLLEKCVYMVYRNLLKKVMSTDVLGIVIKYIGI